MSCQETQLVLQLPKLGWNHLGEGDAFLYFVLELTLIYKSLGKRECIPQGNSRPTKLCLIWQAPIPKASQVAAILCKQRSATIPETSRTDWHALGKLTFPDACQKALQETVWQSWKGRIKRAFRDKETGLRIPPDSLKSLSFTPLLGHLKEPGAGTPSVITDNRFLHSLRRSA